MHVFLIGRIRGYIWQGHACTMDYTLDLTRERRKLAEEDGATYPLDVILRHCLRRDGGDFQNPQLDRSSVIRVTMYQNCGTRQRVVTRDWPITAFPSIREHVSRKRAKRLAMA